MYQILFRTKALLLAVAFSLTTISFNSQAQVFEITDQTSAQFNGMWYVPSESGWGASIIGQNGVLFVAIYAYDVNKKPIWYVASECIVVDTGCRGDLYQVTGGTSLDKPWDGSAKAVTVAGVFQLNFYNENSATMYISAPGSGSAYVTKNIQRQIFGAATSPAGQTQLPIRFKEIIVRGSSASQMASGRCVFRFTFKNMSNYAVTPKLVFDAIDGGVKVGEFAFEGSRLAPAASAAYEQDILVNGKYLVCGDFKMAWNPAKSSTTR